MGAQGSIPSRDIPKLLKMVLVAPRLALRSTQCQDDVTVWYHVKCLVHDISVRQHYKSAHWAPCSNQTLSWYDWKIVESDVKPEQTTTTKWAASWQNQQNDGAPSKDSDQPGHLPSLIRVFAVRMKKAWVLSYPLSSQQRLWSDWADAQADLSLCWAHSHFVGFVMKRLKCFCKLHPKTLLLLA